MNNKMTFAGVVVVLLGIVVVWALVRSRQAKPVTVPTGAKAGDLVLSSCEYKTKTAKYRADCGTLVVPENRNNPGSRLIALPVKRIHAVNPNPAEPIFYLNGGPGQSNMGFKPADWLLADHDVVLVGYRGADGSPVLACPEVNRMIANPGGPAFGEEALGAIAAAMRACADRLTAQGVDLDGYTIPEVVEDVEAARTALGYERIDLLSESYGTRVAQIYAYLHPGSLRRSAMLGVNPPGHFIWEPSVSDAQLRQYSELCQQDGACSARTPDLYASMMRVSTNMPRSWLGLEIDPNKVKALSFMLLFHRSSAPMAFDAFLTAEAGDPSGLALMSLVYDLMMPNAFNWGDLLSKGSIDYDLQRDYISSLQGQGTVLGAPAGLLIWGAGAQGWPMKNLPEEYSRVHPTDVETLLVNGSLDFSTPPQFGEQELLPSLRHGRLVILAGQGHTGDFWQYQPEAARRLLTSFYDTGVADASLYNTLPMDFKPSMRFSTLAKVGAGTGVLLVVGLALALGRAFRRRKVRGKGSPTTPVAGA
jgi:pimeloyl-ACP methyl ester carboxylesterase